MKYQPKDLFAGFDAGPDGRSVVMIGVRQEDGKIKILENIWPKDSGLAESISNAINFTAETASGKAVRSR